MTELVVGYVTKPHGLKGEVLVHLVTNRTERMHPGSTFLTDRGPLTVVACAPQADRWRVRFEGVSDRNAAESLQRLELRAEPLDDPDALWIHELVGAHVVLPDGSPAGTVEAVEANPASDLLVLDTGALVPLVFVVGTDRTREPVVVTIDPPVGLLDLDDAI
jgi:16S rRNA processing protein RimM